MKYTIRDAYATITPQYRGGEGGTSHSWYPPKAEAVLPRIFIRRNKPCPCGSGLKAKRCCLLKRTA